ncbi:MAG TPA: tRNA (guanosine(37)-N1)-methyltransferase TrmD [Candidatus Cloacimonadota bacterium]|nr:tRNA (guanosine(37)-N1)-methyltransferase TrmD [Candidatus Cloacimonadota bacterium]
MLKIEILTLFAETFDGFVSASMVARAQNCSALELGFTDIRDFSGSRQRRVDDYPYGGFAGMVMQAEPIHQALNSVLSRGPAPVIYFSPQGRPLTQDILEHYSKQERLILLCGHYKDIDQRVRDLDVSDEISIGDYVLSGGELAAMVFIDGVARLLPGVLSDIDSARTDSFSKGKLGFPCYSRPESFLEQKVPELLTTGNHRKILGWAEAQAELLTRSRRPDLLPKRG